MNPVFFEQCITKTTNDLIPGRKQVSHQMHLYPKRVPSIKQSFFYNLGRIAMHFKKDREIKRSINIKKRYGFLIVIQIEMLHPNDEQPDKNITCRLVPRCDMYYIKIDNWLQWFICLLSSLHG